MTQKRRKRDRSDLRTELDVLADEVTGFIHSLCPSKVSARVSAALTYGTFHERMWFGCGNVHNFTFYSLQGDADCFCPVTDGSSVLFSCILSSRTLTTESLDRPQ